MSARLRKLEPMAGGVWKLRIRTGEDAEWERVLDAEHFVVGRAEDCEIVLDDERVSKRHFEIQRESGEFVLMDLGSRNGTRVNGQVLSDVGLRPGDLIELGRTKLEVVLETPSVAATPPKRTERSAAKAVISKREVRQPPTFGGPPSGGRPEREQPGPQPADEAVKPVAPASSERDLEGPRRVEVVRKSEVAYASRVEAEHGERRWKKLPVYGLVAALLLLLLISFSSSHKEINAEKNPLARLHSNEGAPAEDLLQKKSETEAKELRRSLLDQAAAALEGQSAELIAKLEAPSLLDQTRARLQAAEQKIAQALATDTEDQEAKGLAERAHSLLRALDVQASTLKERSRGRVQDALERGRGHLAAGRLAAAEESVAEVVALDAGNAEARRLSVDIVARRSASAEASKRQMLLRKYADEVEQFYRAGVNGSDLGNGGKALSDWGEAEEAFRRLQGVPGAAGTPELKKAEGWIADIQRRKARIKPEVDANEKEAERLLGKARLYEELGQPGKAREMWQKVLEILPNSEHRYHKMARQRLEQTD